MFDTNIKDVRGPILSDRPSYGRLTALLERFGSSRLPGTLHSATGRMLSCPPDVPAKRLAILLGSRECSRKKTPAAPFLLAEGGYVVRPIVEGARLVEAYRLRHSVFSVELGWTRVAKDGLEHDEYDNGAVMLGLYDNQGIFYGCLRVVPPCAKFMLEGVFSGILGGSKQLSKTRFTAEASRLCITPAGRRRRISNGCGGRSLAHLLLKGLHRWCMKNGVRSVYAVADDKTIGLYRKWMLPIRVIGGPFAMGDGARSYAIRLFWEDVRLAAQREESDFLAWLLV